MIYSVNTPANACSSASIQATWAQRHAEEKRQASQQTVERLQRDYEKMDIERRENDKQVEELRMEAGDIETKVGLESWSPRSCILMVLRRRQSILRTVKQSSTSYSRNIGSSVTRRVKILLSLYSSLNDIQRYT
jgi:hypothetical protein